MQIRKYANKPATKRWNSPRWESLAVRTDCTRSMLIKWHSLDVNQITIHSIPTIIIQHPMSTHYTPKYMRKTRTYSGCGWEKISKLGYLQWRKHHLFTLPKRQLPGNYQWVSTFSWYLCFILPSSIRYSTLDYYCCANSVKHTILYLTTLIDELCTGCKNTRSSNLVSLELSLRYIHPETFWVTDG